MSGIDDNRPAGTGGGRWCCRRSWLQVFGSDITGLPAVTDFIPRAVLADVFNRRPVRDGHQNRAPRSCGQAHVQIDRRLIGRGRSRRSRGSRSRQVLRSDVARLAVVADFVPRAVTTDIFNGGAIRNRRQHRTPRGCRQAHVQIDSRFVIRG